MLQESVASKHNHTQLAWLSKGPSELIAIALLFSLALGSLNANLFIIFLKGCKIFTSFTELTLLHALAHIPVHECTLAVHEVELVVDAGEHLRDGRGIADHAARPHHLGQVAA